MEYCKIKTVGSTIPTSESDLTLINRQSKTILSANDVYIFHVRLCDNEIDRDYERFSIPALEKLASLFVGKTGLADHSWKASEQFARIYKTEVVRLLDRKTSAGDVYAFLKAYAYILKNPSTESLIRDIEGGIKREVSISCLSPSASCSICGQPTASCAHVPGDSYNGELCYLELAPPSDAYEWSLVAVPAQREAGILKSFSLRYPDFQLGAYRRKGETMLISDNSSQTSDTLQDQLPDTAPSTSNPSSIAPPDSAPTQLPDPSLQTLPPDSHTSHDDSSLHPLVKAKLAEMDAAIKKAKMAELEVRCQQYQILGEKPAELAQKLYRAEIAGVLLDYVSLLNKAKDLAEASSLFSEIGSSSFASPSGDSVSKIDGLAEKIASSEGISIPEARAKAWKQNKDIRKQYNRGRSSTIPSERKF